MTCNYYIEMKQEMRDHHYFQRILPCLYNLFVTMNDGDGATE